MHDALRAIGRAGGSRSCATEKAPHEGVCVGELSPGDFTGHERYRMIEAVLHAQAFPGGMEGHVPEWRVQRRDYTLSEWELNGRRRFVQEVSTAALGELDEVDYTSYDLSPLRRLIGNGLDAADRTAYRLRLDAMKADLALLGRKARRLSDVSAASEISYRIVFYEHAFEARIRTGGRLATWFTKGK